MSKHCTNLSHVDSNFEINTMPIKNRIYTATKHKKIIALHESVAARIEI